VRRPECSDRPYRNALDVTQPFGTLQGPTLATTSPFDPPNPQFPRLSPTQAFRSRLPSAALTSAAAAAEALLFVELSRCAAEAWSIALR